MKFSSTARTFVICAATTLSIAGACAAGCSSSSVAPNTPDAAATCPSTFDGANFAACTHEGFTCGYDYPCEGTLLQVANCTCTGGVFQCSQQVAGVTTAIDAGAEPTCQTIPPIKPTCPATYAAGEGVTCSDPGLDCPYAGQICNGTATFDTCQCVADGNGSAPDAGLAFKCERAICNTEAGVTPVTDSGSDAAIDSGAD